MWRHLLGYTFMVKSQHGKFDRDPDTVNLEGDHRVLSIGVYKWRAVCLSVCVFVRRGNFLFEQDNTRYAGVPGCLIMHDADTYLHVYMVNSKPHHPSPHQMTLFP